MFPDRATLYICAIEDRQYKDDKITCKFIFVCVIHIRFIIHQLQSELILLVHQFCT